MLIFGCPQFCSHRRTLQGRIIRPEKMHRCYMPQTANSWSTLSEPPRLYRVNPPLYEKPHSASLLQTMTDYVNLCERGIDLVHSLEPRLQSLYLRIARQYLDLVCRPLETTAREYEDHATEQLNDLKDANDQLCDRLQDVKAEADGAWLAMTMFEPVFAALASKYKLGPGFKVNVQQTESAYNWLVAAANFMPTVVVFDTCCYRVGISAPRWEKCWPLYRSLSVGAGYQRCANFSTGSTATHEGKTRDCDDADLPCKKPPSAC